MIDGIKILNLKTRLTAPVFADYIQATKNVNSAGEIISQFAQRDGLEFTIKNDNIKLSGSLHKYYNAGRHNHNDFSYDNICSVLNTLETVYNIDLTSELNNLEYGVNIITTFNPDRFINSLIMHKGEQFKPYNVSTDRECSGKECTHSDYYIKIYNKQKQYSIPDNVLRCEIKVVSMKYFNQNNIRLKTLGDLKNINIYSKMQALLTATINDCLIYNIDNQPQRINKTERLILSNGRSFAYWQDLKPNSLNYKNGNKDKNYYSAKKKYYSTLEKYNETHNKFSTGKIKEDTINLINQKYSELTQIKGNEFQDIKQQNKVTNSKLVYSCNSLPSTLELFNILTTIFQIIENYKKEHLGEKEKLKLCPVTGLNISMQKGKSKFLSVTGLNYYYLHDINIYYKLEKRYLHKQHNNLEIKDKFYYIAHNIRNEKHNPVSVPTHRLIKKINKINDNALFDSNKYMQFTAEQTELLNRKNYSLCYN
ncbi:MAG: hypothetical protein KA792_06820 [Bacteroidales bacterium]|nr:hypothetical protein [Bacteroidales bacterium]MBP7497357.1 hypothetical protein [Bacteroidales bacterium]